MKIKGLSLFANVGVAEAYMKSIGIDILLANEIDIKRAEFYKHIYPEAEMIIGDIIDKNIREAIIEKSRKFEINFILATPPCQGMSIAGKMNDLDPRNQLIFYAVDVIKKVKPRFVLLENVPQQLKTKIKIDNQILLISEYIIKELSHDYNFNEDTLVRAMDYDVPQMRKRNIFLLTRKDTNIIWKFPPIKEAIPLREALKGTPSLDPMLREGMELTLQKFPEFLNKSKQALNISKWHKPPIHSWKLVEWMIHTPSGCTAFDNKKFYPQKANEVMIHGHSNHYRRHDWNKPSRTITQNNGVISSLACVHPGYLINDDGTEEGRIYSDPRVFSIYELLIIMSLPKDWDIPSWAEDTFIRNVIGEGIPPKLVKNIMEELLSKL